MNNEKTIEVLNTLIEINNDRIEGYETASKETEEQDLKIFFSQLSKTSKKCKQELAIEVNKLGGTPTEETKITGKFFRVWMDVKAALTGKDRKAILNSCEYGEDVAVKTYEKALENEKDNLSFEHQTLVRGQYTWIKADHDKVKEMRDALIEVA
jgi:uncharacterized protein (TIGR02284 family)